MKKFSRSFLVGACVIGSTAVMPAASAQEPGCTETYVAAATRPESDSPDFYDVNIRHLEEGVYVNPFNAPARVADYVFYEVGVLGAYLDCI